MKKTILTIILSCGLYFANGQITGKKDSVWTPTDSTEFIMIKDINDQLAKLGDQISFNDFNKIKVAFQNLVNEAIERRRKRKP